MKRSFILFSFLFTMAAGSFTTAQAQVNTTDSLALVDLYNSTNGSHWYYSFNWLTAKPVSTWYGVTVSGNRVTRITLFQNKLSGTIPATIGNLTNLQYIDLYANFLTGTIPAAMYSLTNLQTLYLSENQLSGTIPSEIGNLVNLYYLLLQNNQLSGAIPPEIGNLTKLNKLVLGSNQLTGAIPAEIGNLINLQTLYLSDNQLSGAIPASFNQLKQLVYIYIDHNLLSQGDNISFPVDKKNYINGNISYNLFTFNGVQLTAKRYPLVAYAPQKTVLSIHQSGNTLSVSAGGTLRHNTYRWHQAGVAEFTTINADSTFTPLQSGMYYVIASNNVANKLKLHSDTINFVMPVAKQSSNTLTARAAQPATGIQHLLVYPNPAKDIIHIGVNGIATITLTNSDGKVLLTKTINNSDAINVGGFANGVYHIQNKTTGDMQKIVVIH